MNRYDFVKTIGIISCEECNIDILKKIEKKKRHLKSDISNIDKVLANTAYYIDGDAKRYIFFNITPDFIKYIAFKYERTSFVFATVTNSGLECQYWEKQDMEQPSFRWNPHIKVAEWCNAFAADMQDYCITYKDDRYDIEITIPTSVLSHINATIAHNLEHGYNKEQFANDIYRTGYSGYAFRTKANKYLQGLRNIE
ncbi:MAG: hypothetical protein IKY79_02560 [Bacteroidales bacterium]|nr:hypothetical protein [Bacteroidales bacterium]